MATGINSFGDSPLRYIPYSIIGHGESRTISGYHMYQLFLFYGNTVGMVVALRNEGANVMTVGGALSVTASISGDTLTINNTSSAHNYRCFGVGFKTLS